MATRANCYVSTPFGTKSAADGRLIDHDHVYLTGIRPALEALGTTVLRADEMSGAIVMKSVFDALIGCEVMVADISGGNANVMYELGVRHALRRGITVLVMAAGGHIPYNIAYARVIAYAIDEDGRLRSDAADEFRDTLIRAVGAALERITIDSPLYQFYPSLAVDLPQDMAVPELRRRLQPAVKRADQPEMSGLATTGDAAPQPAPVAEPPQPLQLLGELRRLRDASAWEALVQAAKALPAEVASAPEAIQLTALALNRLGRQDEAIACIQTLIDETGGDAESYGILGRVYKDRHRRTGDPRDLDAAINTYQTGFDRQPTEFYPGINAVTLRAVRNAPEDHAALQTLIPRVRQAIDSRLPSSGGDYWTVASALELACVDRDWETADALLLRAVQGQTLTPWMVDSTVQQLRTYADAMGQADRDRLERVLAQLKEAGHA